MNSKVQDHAFFDIMREEHEEMATVLHELEEVVARDGEDKSAVEQLTNKLAELVESHFRHEEQGGYLTDATSRAPQLTGKADILLEEHEALLEEVQKLCILVHSGVESAAWWTRIESDLHKFSSRLLNHEKAENDLVQEAFTQDIGAGD